MGKDKEKGNVIGIFKPHYNIERSRMGVQCRTGLKGSGHAHRIPFGDEGEEAAIRKAEA